MLQSGIMSLGGSRPEVGIVNLLYLFLNCMFALQRYCHYNKASNFRYFTTLLISAYSDCDNIEVITDV